MISQKDNHASHDDHDHDHDHGHDHDEHDHAPEEKGGHGHTHGIVDPSILTTERGIWAVK